MCGRYTLTTDAQALVDIFQIERLLFDPAELRPRFNIAPSQAVPIVRITETGRELLLARWGLVPHWSREATTKYSTINARAESVAEKPTYRDAFRRKRCLIPATGFYEWKREGETKVPYYIHPQDAGAFALAGLWDRWERDGEGFDSCSIIVTQANPAMQQIHERMPVILNPVQYNTWLNTGHFNRAQLQSLLLPFSGELDIYPVSRKVNSPGNDAPALIEKWSG
jgi:putative SOS response-associated peptidase YedK